MNITDLFESEGKGGVNCQYYNMGNEMGLKVYTDKNKAHITHWRQRLAAQHGLAPKTYGKPFYVKTHGWAYFTESVPYVVANHPDYDSTQSTKVDYWNDFLDFTDRQKKLKEKLKDLFGDSPFLNDIHIENVGVDSSGKLLCIDFLGIES